MKRTALLLLTAIYLISTLGVTASSYYCRGKLQSTTLVGTPAGLPGCKMAGQMKNCRKIKKQFFKVTDAHIYSTAFSMATKLFPAVQGAFLVYQTNMDASMERLFNIDIHAPPRGKLISAYILNCDYRI